MLARRGERVIEDGVRRALWFPAPEIGQYEPPKERLELSEDPELTGEFSGERVEVPDGDL